MNNSFKIEKVAVLGTGVMGAQIAAHCTNAGLKVFAFDIKQNIAEEGIEKATKIKPKAFYDKKNILCSIDGQKKPSEISEDISIILKP